MNSLWFWCIGDNLRIMKGEPWRVLILVDTHLCKSSNFKTRHLSEKDKKCYVRETKKVWRLPSLNYAMLLTDLEVSFSV